MSSFCIWEMFSALPRSKVGAVAGLMGLLAFLFHASPASGEPVAKKQSAFYSPPVLAKIRQNLDRHPDGEQLKNDAIQKAEFWKNTSDEELWEMMFGPKITRSWMVWSNGDCPACKKSVPMYTWIMDPQKLRWKTRCPHCKETFPKNDFEAFYRSGLDEHGVYDPARADRKLLFNNEHPDPSHPLHQFGVDDGEGFVSEGQRWRFIGAYLVYGQFKKLVLGGIEALAVAYIYTGEEIYGRKAGILLDRVADLYPSFDYVSQGLVYEQRAATYNGYVSIWHDSCEETRALALCYDQVFEGMRNSRELVNFLSATSQKYKLANPKETFADIQRNIEGGLLLDPLKNKHKVHSNFPRAECTLATIQTVLAWPENRAQVEAYIDSFVKTATSVDGVTGEKGLSGYSSYTISGLASFLAEYSRAEPDFLKRLLERQPSLKQTYRFHIDTFCLDKFYPDSGDCGGFGKPANRYVGAHFPKLTQASVAPSMFSFFWQLYEATGDPGYVQVLYRENGRTLEGLPHDLFLHDAATFQKQVRKVIAKEGAEFKVGSINKQQWRIAILRSGKAENARALWLDYDSGGAHGHHDGMNIGLFAHGISLLPEFGYPPVQFGGWTTPRAQWYLHTAAHNTVVVDGRNHPRTSGTTTLWADGVMFRAIAASCPQMTGGARYERTVALVDVSGSQYYAIDLFRVEGGLDHAKFVHGPQGTMTVSGLTLSATEDYGNGTQMRNFRRDTNSPINWTATWKLEDQYKVLPEGKTVHFRHTDLSSDVQAYTAEAWIAPYFRTHDPEIWNPSIMVRRRGNVPMKSTFVSVMESFEQTPTIVKAKRVPVFQNGEQLPEPTVAMEIALPGGMRDLLIAADPKRPVAEGMIHQPDWDVTFTGEMVWLRVDAKYRLQRVALCRGTRLILGENEVSNPASQEFLEVDFSKRKPRVISGKPDGVVIQRSSR